MKQIKVKPKPSSLERLNQMRVGDDHFIYRENFKPDKVYDVLEEWRDIHMTRSIDFHSGVPVTRQNVQEETVYYIIQTESGEEEDFLASDFEEV
ncbi:MAG: hypothetical protein ACLFTR_04935 [Candidatus Woesearchaeota archaeon]